MNTSQCRVIIARIIGNQVRILSDPVTVNRELSAICHWVCASVTCQTDPPEKARKSIDL